jgi:hypothetical protein
MKFLLSLIEPQMFALIYLSMGELGQSHVPSLWQIIIPGLSETDGSNVVDGNWLGAGGDSSAGSNGITFVEMYILEMPGPLMGQRLPQLLLLGSLGHV